MGVAEHGTLIKSLYVYCILKIKIVLLLLRTAGAIETFRKIPSIFSFAPFADVGGEVIM